MSSVQVFEMTSQEKVFALGLSEEGLLHGDLVRAAKSVLAPAAKDQNFSVAQILTEGAIAAFNGGRTENLRTVLTTFEQMGFFKNEEFADGVCYQLCKAIASNPEPAEALRQLGKNGLNYQLDGIDQFPINNMLLCYATRHYEAKTAPDERQKYARVIDAVTQAGTNWEFLNGQAIRLAYDANDRRMLRKFHDAGADFEAAARSMEREKKTVYDPGWIVRNFLGASRVVTKDPASQAEQLRDLDRLFSAEKTIDILRSGPNAEFLAKHKQEVEGLQQQIKALKETRRSGLGGAGGMG